MPRAPAIDPTAQYLKGDVIAEKYELVKELAAGGMGSLWVARNLALDAEVALKLVRAEVATKELEERFLFEARILARLRHPNIVRVFDFGRSSRGDPFIVMELLIGETLGRVLERQHRLPATDALRLLLPIADALATAHQKDIVHRDIKPENVFLAEDEGRLQPKILDFGIAKLAVHGPNTEERRLTQTGVIVGSPEYLSPEQARGLEEVDHRSDIWSLSVVIYETVTGELPFDGKNYHALLRSIIEGEPNPTTELGAGDQALWDLVRVGLAKEPADRYATMRELGTAFARWLYSHGVEEDVCGHSLKSTWLVSGPDMPALGRARLSTMPGPTTTPPTPLPAVSSPPPTKPRRWGRALVVVAVLSGLAFLGYSLMRQRATPPTASVPRVVLEEARPELTTVVVLPAQPPAASQPPVPRSTPVATRSRPKTAAVAPATSAAPPPSTRPVTEDLGF
jgi:serine/threonine-protein kinase